MLRPRQRASGSPTFDTLYYHEYRLKLAHSAHTRVELRVHPSRDFAYALIIGTLGFVTWHGAFAWILLALLVAEICITLWDFIEEDRIRRLPPGERAMHAVMGIVYGASWPDPSRFLWKLKMA